MISLYSIDWLVFITETECVYCAARSTFYVLPTQCIYVFCVDLRTISATAANPQADSYPTLSPSQYTPMLRIQIFWDVTLSFSQPFPTFRKTAVP
jgi:hypothetical protein